MNRSAWLTPRPKGHFLVSLILTAVIALIARRYLSDTGVFIATNVFQMVDWMAMKSLFLIKNKLAVASNFYMDAKEEFTKPYAVNDVVRIKKPWRAQITSGLPYNPQSIVRVTTPVNLDQIFGVHFEWDSYERAVKMERGEAALENEYIKPAMAQIAQEFDSRAALWAYQNSNNIVGILGTDPTTFDATSAAARQRLVELGGAQDEGDRVVIVPPNIMRSLKATQLTYFNPNVEISKAYRTGIVGNADGFDWYESMSLYSHTAGSLTATPTVSVSVADGATSIVLSVTSGDTVKKGDVLSFAACNQVNPMTRRKTTSVNKPFVATADVTATGSTMTVPVSPAFNGPGNTYQNVDALPLSGATVTLFSGTSSPNGKAGVNGLAFTKHAFAMVGVPLEMPKACEPGSFQRQDPETGISIRFVRMFDPTQSKMVNRFDVLCGFGNLYSDECSVRILGA